MGKKYWTERDPETRLLRIIARKDFADVKKGDRGGLIKNESNLSQKGDCWIYDNARVLGDAEVSGDAKVCDNAKIIDNARVYGGCVCGNAKLSGNVRVGKDARISGNVKLYSTWHSYTDASIKNNKDYVMLATRNREIAVFATERTFLSKIMKDSIFTSMAFTTTSLNYIKNIDTIRQLYEKEI